MSTLSEMLLIGPMPELKTLSKKDALAECKLWRQVWQWTPPEVKYYIARVGMLVGLTMRNYSRMTGILRQTHWKIEEIELGVKDKTYDAVTGGWVFEKKIVRTKLGGVIDFQFISEQESEEAREARIQEEMARIEAEEREKGEPVDTVPQLDEPT